MAKTIVLTTTWGRSRRLPILAVRGAWALHHTVYKPRRRHYTITHVASGLAAMTRLSSRRVALQALRKLAALPGDWTFTDKPTNWRRRPALRAAYRIAERCGEFR